MASHKISLPFKAEGNGKAWYDYVEGIEHNGYKTSLVEYTEERQIIYKKGVQKGRRRKVEKCKAEQRAET